MTRDSELIARLRPSAVVDEVVGKAVSALRKEGFGMLAGSLNEWLVENNGLKSEAASRLEAIGKPVGYVTRDAIAEVAAGRIGNHLFPAGTLRPENEVAVYTSPVQTREDGIREAAKMVAALRDDSRQEPMGFKEIAERILALLSQPKGDKT